MRTVFFCVRWSPDREVACEAADRFLRAAITWRAQIKVLRRGPGFLLLADQEPALSAHTDRRAVDLFGEINLPSAPTRFAERVVAIASPSLAARLLTEEAWGSYAAIIRDGSGTFAYRDPSGAFPLYIARSKHLRIAGTCLTPHLLDEAGFHRPVNLQLAARVLTYPPAAAHLSLLPEVSIVGPGCLANLEGDAPDETIWSPSAIAANPGVVEPEEIVERLDRVVSSLARGRRVGVELSGGFDSSVVFASLAATGAAPRAFTVATAGEGGDERRFAQSMTARWNATLEQYGAGQSLPDYRIFTRIEHDFLPFLHGADSVFANARDDFVTRQGVEVVMTGQGGDALFFRLPTRLIAADRRRSLGISSLIGEATFHDAVRVQGSVWSVLATALGLRLPDDKPALPALFPHLLGPTALTTISLPGLLHPWLEDASKLPPAKQRHLTALMHCQLFHGARIFAPAVPLMHPLLTQPMLELLLRCPTFVLAQGPLDRGLARFAMADRLSDPVLGRRSKGEASDHYARAALANRVWLTEILLDGLLVGAGLLDRNAIEEALKPDAIRLRTDYNAFVTYSSLETWLRYWSVR